MKTLTSIIVVLASSAALAAFNTTGFTQAGSLKVKGDRVAADRVSENVIVTGNVEAVAEPYRMMTDGLTKEGKTYHCLPPTMVTTCTNELDNLHWKAEGEIEYKDGDYLWGKDLWVYFWGIPVIYLPYWYYPIDELEGWRFMVGKAGHWGWFMSAKYVYNLYTSQDGRYNVRAASRLDLREENGVAVGQSFRWTLGDYGHGKFKVYYADDNDYDRYTRKDGIHQYSHDSSDVDRDRYAVAFDHQMDLSERDIFNIHVTAKSDSRMYDDFLKKRFTSLMNDIDDDTISAASIEHVENWAGAGISASAPLMDFNTGRMALPEVYFDVNPMPLFNTGLNYESQTSMGYYRRQRARYGSSDLKYRYSPGIWASYGTFRLDTYHRVTKPMKYNDWLSIVPRLGYRGTLYGNSGYVTRTGYERAGRTDNAIYRSIIEAGTTFSARGTAWVNDEWQTVIEPYMDILMQRSITAGLDRGERNFVFDSNDMSMDWSDQFAGRGRNLPYSYYGITPGFRKLYRKVNESGTYDGIFDFDVYAAVNFGKGKEYKKDYMPYGHHDVNFTPGVRARWMPDKNTTFGVRAEYNCDEDNLALMEVSWQQRLARDLKASLTYTCRNHRYYDYSIIPGDDRLGNARYNYVTVQLEHDIVDWLAWGPFVRWDCNAGEYDEYGAWFDLRTDCLGFRFQMSETSGYTRNDGARYNHSVDFGAYIYLRAMGAPNGDPMEMF